MTRSSIQRVNGGYSLIFYCGDLPVDDAIVEAGHEPNGYFWEGVTEFLAREVINRLELDSEAGMYCATGEKKDLVMLQSILEPLLSNIKAVRGVIKRAEDAKFEFDD